MINATDNELTTSYTFIKANNTLDSMTGVTNNNIYNYDPGKYHKQATKQHIHKLVNKISRLNSSNYI